MGKESVNGIRGVCRIKFSGFSVQNAVFSVVQCALYDVHILKLNVWWAVCSKHFSELLPSLPSAVCTVHCAAFTVYSVAHNSNCVVCSL